MAIHLPGVFLLGGSPIMRFSRTSPTCNTTNPMPSMGEPLHCARTALSAPPIALAAPGEAGAYTHALIKFAKHFLRVQAKTHMLRRLTKS